MPDYLKIDERMTPQEKRQQFFRTRYKQLNPRWDDSIILLSRLFEKYCPESAAVLDAGCGRSNYVLETNKRHVGKIIGFDATAGAVAGNTVADEVVIGDLEKLPFADGSFDCVTSLWVLEHVHDAPKVFGEISRVLKPGGRFFFVTPYSFSYILLGKRIAGAKLNRVVLRHLYGRTEEDTFHTEYMANTPGDIRRLAQAHGLREVALIENEDPSYLAFNRFTFGVARRFQYLCNVLGLRTAKMHLIGVYEKGG